jgi:zinc protease
MKKIFQYTCLLIAMVAPFIASAQQAKPYDMMVNGVKVIVQPSGNDIVVIQTVIKGGVQNYSAEKAGIENMALTALTECGTMKDDKNSFKDKLDKVSAYVSGGSGMDYASFNLNCIKSDLDAVWPLYVDALTIPKFDAKEFERIKQDAINGIRSSESSPDNAINKLAKQTAFAGTSYAKEPRGTVASITALTPAETKKYWESTFTKSRIVIVVVADLDKTAIEAKVKELLAKVPAGSKFASQQKNYTPAANTFKAEERANATNYVRGIASGPLPGTPDYTAFSLAMSIFSSKHFIEVRTKHGLSYAPQAWFNGGNTSYASLSVTTTEPDKYIAVARGLIDRIKKEGFSADELKNEKTGFLTGIYYRNETNEAQASSMAANEVLHGDWKRAITMKEEVDKVTLQQLNAAFNKYINNITWVYQGDPKKVNATMYTQKDTPAMPAEKKAF